MHDTSQKDELVNELEIYNYLLGIFRHDIIDDKQGDFTHELFSKIPGQYRVVLSQVLSSSTKLDFKEISIYTYMSYLPKSVVTLSSVPELISNIRSQNDEIWYIRQGKRSYDKRVKKTCREHATALKLYNSWLEFTDKKSETANCRWLNRLFKPLIGKEIKKKGNKYCFEGIWSYFRDICVKSILERKDELIGKETLEHDLFTHNPISKITKELNFTKGLLTIDLNYLKPDSVNYIKKQPHKARRIIRGLIIDSITLDEEIEENLIINFELPPEDSFDDIFNHDGEKLLAFSASVIWHSEPIEKKGHVYLKLKLGKDGSSISPHLSYVKGSFYTRYLSLERLRKHSGLYNITCIVEKHKRKNRSDEFDYRLDVLSLKIPPAVTHEPSMVHVDKYNQRIKEIGFADAFDEFVECTAPKIKKRLLMKKTIALSAVSVFDKAGRASHALIVGDPEQGKSEIIRYYDKIIGGGNCFGCEESSSNIVSRAIRIDDAWTLARGPFTEEHGYYIMADEFQTVPNEAINSLLNLTVDGVAKVKKGDIIQDLDMYKPIICFANPSGEKKGLHYETRFNLDDTNLFSQLPLNLTQNMKSRFDQILCVTSEDLTHRDKHLIHKSIWLRHENNWGNKYYTDEEVKSVFWHVRDITCRFDTKSLENTIDVLDKFQFDSTRSIGGIKRLAVSFAKFRLSTVVQEIDLNHAIQQLRDVNDTHTFRRSSF